MFLVSGQRLRNPGVGDPGFSQIATRTLPQNPLSRPPKLAPADLSIVLCTPIHSDTRRGGCLRIWGGFGVWGREGGWRFMKTRGFRFREGPRTEPASEAVGTAFFRETEKGTESVSTCAGTINLVSLCLLLLLCCAKWVGHFWFLFWQFGDENFCPSSF